MVLDTLCMLGWENGIICEYRIYFPNCSSVSRLGRLRHDREGLERCQPWLQHSDNCLTNPQAAGLRNEGGQRAL